MTIQSGILVVDKPVGMTSHDVVNRVRRHLGTRRVGHAGTLDPDATGVLVLGINDGTRILEYLTAEEKQYAGVVVFGVSTNTDDASGEVQRVMPADSITEQDVRRSSYTLVGTYEQEVPLFSAVHISGKRAHELARKGGYSGPLPSREVRIESLSVTHFHPGTQAEAGFEVRCGKGTYIRSLCRDWGQRLGVPAHMASLRRLASGAFEVNHAVLLTDFLASDEPWQYLMPLSQALSCVPQVTVERSVAERLANGQRVVMEVQGPEGVYAVCTPDNEFWLIAEYVQWDGRHVLRPKKVFRRT